MHDRDVILCTYANEGLSDGIICVCLACIAQSFAARGIAVYKWEQEGASKASSLFVIL